MSEKPLRADARRNRALVLGAAREAFAEEGLAVPLDEIARRAGVGAGTVYRHFPTKEALFEAVLVTRIEQLVSEAEELAGADDPGEAFFGFLHRLLSRAVADKDFVEALAAAGAPVAESTADAKRDLQGAGGQLLARAQRAGAVRTDVNVADLLALLSGITTAAQRTDDAGLPERLFILIRDGLLPEGRHRSGSPRRGGEETYWHRG